MRKKILWMLVSCLMVLSLIMASCGPAEEEAEVEVGEEEVEVGEVEVAEEEEEEEAVAEGPEVPQYGGTLALVIGGDIMGFDEATTPDYWDNAGHLTHDELLEGDWAKGPAGTGQFTWKTNDVYRWDSKSGALA